MNELTIERIDDPMPLRLRMAHDYACRYLERGVPAVNIDDSASLLLQLADALIAAEKATRKE